LAGLVTAKQKGIVEENETAVLDSTAHAIKFSDFQKMYFENSFPAEFEVMPRPDLINKPTYVHPKNLEKVPAPGAPLQGEDMKTFIDSVSQEIAERLDLKKV